MLCIADAIRPLPMGEVTERAISDPILMTLVQCLDDRGIEQLQSRFEIALQMHAQGAPAALGQHVKIAARLRRLDHPKTGLLTGHREIPGVIRCDLQEYAAVRSALVGLAGGMQETRAEFGAGRDMALVAYRKPPA